MALELTVSMHFLLVAFSQIVHVQKGTKVKTIDGPINF